MRILEIVPSLRPGGGERLVVDLSNELAKTHDVALLTLWDDNMADFGFYKPDLSPQVSYLNANVKEKNKLSVLWSIAKYVRKVNPDVVHLHMCHMFALLAIMLHGRSHKFYLTIHNDVKRSYANNPVKFLFNLFGKAGLLKFVTISRTNYNDFNEVYPKLCNDLVYNGREPLFVTEKFKEVQEEILAFKSTYNTKIFLHIARCSPQKNQRLLIEAFNQFILGKNDAVLLVIGAHFNDSEEGIALQRMACDRIKFLGTRANVADYIFNCDAFCLSSIFEGMPITLIESLNSGIPIISTPVCGVVDVVQDGINGILSKDFEVTSYIDCLRRFIVCESDLKFYCRQNAAVSPFTIANCALEYVELFKKAF